MEASHAAYQDLCPPCDKPNAIEDDFKRKLGKKRYKQVMMVYISLCILVAVVVHFAAASVPEEVCRAAFYTLSLAMVVAWVSFVPETPAQPGSDTDPDFYADTRALACACGIPNSNDVISNAGLVVAGAYGLWLLRDPNGTAGDGVLTLSPLLLLCWRLMNFWICVGGFASAWYHLDPLHHRLAADRGPIAGGMVTFVVALIVARESASLALGITILVIANCFGLYSVAHFLYQRQCRPYYFCQYGVISVALGAALLLPAQPAGEGVWVIIALYTFAKMMEDLDLEVYQALREVMSGHTIKHLVASIAALVMNLYIVNRGTL